MIYHTLCFRLAYARVDAPKTRGQSGPVFSCPPRARGCPETLLPWAGAFFLPPARAGMPQGEPGSLGGSSPSPGPCGLLVPA